MPSALLSNLNEKHERNQKGGLREKKNEKKRERERKKGKRRRKKKEGTKEGRRFVKHEERAH